MVETVVDVVIPVVEFLRGVSHTAARFTDCVGVIGKLGESSFMNVGGPIAESLVSSCCSCRLFFGTSGDDNGMVCSMGAESNPLGALGPGLDGVTVTFEADKLKLLTSASLWDADEGTEGDGTLCSISFMRGSSSFGKLACRGSPPRKSLCRQFAGVAFT